MKAKDIDKLVVALMIITILTIISTGITVSREVHRLEKVVQCQK